MTKLSYVFTATDGNKVKDLTYKEATQLVARMGGHITAVYTKVEEPTDSFSKRRKEILKERRNK